MNHFKESRRKTRGENKATQPIQQASMTRKQATGIFRGKNTLNQRLEKVADLSEEAQHSGKRDDLDRAQFRNQKTRSEAAPHDTPYHVPQHSFDGFARTDLRREFSLAKVTAGQISRRVAHHYHQENKKYPRATVRHAKQQDPMGQQITEIDGTEERPREPIQSFRYFSRHE